MTLDQIWARALDCRTYNFGMRNADKLAKEDVPALLAAVDAVLALAGYWDTLAPGDQYYADKIRTTITEALEN